MTRKAFFELAQRWQANEVRAALAEEPALALAVEPSGMTALHRCARAALSEDGPPAAAAVETARALLAAGADVNAVRAIDDDGEIFHATPLWYALAWGHNRELIHFLVQSGASAKGCVWAVAFQEDIAMADLLRPRGLELDALYGGKTALLESVIGKRFQAVDWLLAHGANPNLGDEEGWTPLHHAVKRGHSTERIARLLAYGASPDVRALDGSTPLALARSLGKRRLVELFSA